MKKKISFEEELTRACQGSFFSCFFQISAGKEEILVKKTNLAYSL